MQDDISEEDKPIYLPRHTIYRGDAEGGPNDGKVMVCAYLTEFVMRKVERKPVDYNGRSVMGLSVQERNQLAEAEKALMKESIWAKQNPHRYDFDLDRQVWVYVEYAVSPMEEEE